MITADQLICREENKITARVTFDVTFYLSAMEGGESALVHVYESVLSELGANITWYRTERMKRALPVSQWALAAFPTWFSHKLAERSEYGLQLSSGRTPEEVGTSGFRFFLAPSRLEVEAGYFQFHLKAPLLEMQRRATLRLVRNIANILPFRSGHAGYAVQYDECSAQEDRDKHLRAWCRRYRGLDCHDLGMIRSCVLDSIKGINWLTMLDQEFCDRLGGIARLRRILPPAIGMTKLRSGCLIRAGKNPRLGDRNRREDLLEYRIVNAALKPLRMEGAWSTPWFAPEEAREWLERFDTT